MVTSILPSFLTSTLHSGPAALGTIDGIADALTGLAKLAGGPLATEPARRARVAAGGYLGTALCTAAIGVTVAVWQVAVLRSLAWISRGIRSPARDSLLVSLVPRGSYGRATGVERAGDNLGAFVGPLLASLFVAVFGVRTAVLAAVVPGMLAAVAITVAAREAGRSLSSAPGRARLHWNLGELRRAGLPAALTPAALFEFGNVATTLLILRATDLLHADGRSMAAATSVAILLYAGHNIVAALAALLGGRLVDVAGPRSAFALGAVAYVPAYVLFAVGDRRWPVLLLAFVLAGSGIGLGETAQSAAVALLLPDHLRGNGFGVLGLVQSLGDLVATVGAGVLWAGVGPSAAFVYAAGWMIASLAASVLLRRRV
jgi:MFS family permease